MSASCLGFDDAIEALADVSCLQAVSAFSSCGTTAQRFSFEIGRVSSIETRSPTL